MVYLVRFYLADLVRLLGPLDVVESVEGRFVYLYSDESENISSGSNKAKALTFSSALLAIQFLGRNSALRSIRHVAFIDRDIRGSKPKFNLSFQPACGKSLPIVSVGACEPIYLETDSNS